MNDNLNLIYILNELLKEYTIKSLSNKLNIANGTIKRWILLNNIPKKYELDLLKLYNYKIIDYSKYSPKDKDQYFTPKETAKKCFDIFIEEIKKYNDNYEDFIFIEPSAGNGNFLEVLPKNTIAIDIEPLNEKIIKEDYLEWIPNNNNRYIVIGNPPFGLRGHQALKFINHSAKFAEYVCFILPQLFASDGKGVPRKRVKGLNLIYSNELNTKFYDPNNNEIDVKTILQIWSKYNINTKYNINKFNNNDIQIYSMSNGGTSSSSRNISMIGKCDIYIPSTCFGKENMKYYINFEELPSQRGYGIKFLKNKEEYLKKILNIDLSKIAFLSTNSAYNLRSSHIYSLFN